MLNVESFGFGSRGRQEETYRIARAISPHTPGLRSVLQLISSASRRLHSGNRRPKAGKQAPSRCSLQRACRGRAG